MKPADLGTCLLYDQDGGYLVVTDGPLLRLTTLDSDVTLIDDPAGQKDMAELLRHAR